MPRLTQSEIHSDFSSASETWSEYRAQVIAFYDNYPHSELNDHITREFNKKIRDLGQDESLYISPYNAGLRYIGDGVFTVDPLSFNPYFYIDAASSMLGVLESPSLDLNPAVPSTLDIITATRAGTATYTDASGNIQTASPNTVRVDHVQGEELTPTKFQRVGYTDFSSGWQKIKVTEVDGGGFNGQVSKVLTVINDNILYRINCPTSSGVVYTASIYARLISGTGTLKINHQNSPSGSDTVVSISSQWQRFEVDFIGLGGSTAVGLRGMLTGDVIEVSSLQVEEGTTASDFVANTTGSPKYFAAATYGPRVPMILVEPAATNLVTYSEDFSQWGTKAGATLTANYGISPDGTQNSTRLQFGGASKTLADNITTSSSSTGSVWVKGTAGETIRFGVYASESLFTLNGSWQRIQRQGTSTSNMITINTWNGATARDLEIWGGQLEDGTVATSFIPTSGSAVTRAADDLVIDGSDFTDFYNATEGTIYAEVETTNYNGYLFSINDGSTANRIISRASSVNFFVSVSGVIQSSMSYTPYPVSGSLYRRAASYKANNFLLSNNGATVVSDSSGAVPSSLTRVLIGSGLSAGTHLNGHIKRLIYWPYHSDNI